MSIETVFFYTPNKIELTGIIHKSDKKTNKIMIFVHGMSSNAIKYRSEVIAKDMNQIDIDFFAFNNRGHELTSYYKKKVDGKTETKLGGSSYEDIFDSYDDICGSINYAISLGYTDIYLSGHSLGCTKILYMYNKLKENNEKSILNKIKAIILLSLIDIQAVQKIYLNDKYDSTLEYAINKEKENKENELMPEKSFIHPISVKTYLRYFKYNEEVSFPKYSDKNYEFKELNNIKVPLFMRWGTEKEMIIQKPNDLCELVKANLSNKELDISYIEGAPHGYSSKEKILSDQIVNFLCSKVIK